MSGPIRTTERFFEVLASATEAVRDRTTSEKGNPTWPNLLQQLNKIAEWTLGGRCPTAKEQKAISIGLITVREIEPAMDAQTYYLTQMLHELNYFFRRWPSSR